MTGDVISFKSEKKEAWISGPAKCTACKHEWVAIAEAGNASSLECPNCQAFRGVTQLHIGHVENSETFICDCGTDVFMLIRRTSTSPGELCCIGCGDTMVW